MRTMTLARALTRLAREARRLAYECAEGTAPDFGIYLLHEAGRDTSPCCALGHVYFRAFGRAVPAVDLSALAARLLPAMEVLTEANNWALPGERRSAVVFPLLAYADALEGR